MIVGKTKIGGTPLELAINTKRTATFTFTAGQRIPKLVAYLDGLGSGVGDTLLKPLIYTGAGVFVAVGDEIVVPQDDPGAWRDVTFAQTPGGVLIPTAGTYDLGFLVGGSNNSARVWVDDPDSPGGHVNANTYTSGPSTPFGSGSTTGRFSIFADTFISWKPPANEFEMVLGRLPFIEAQARFRETPPVAGSARVADLSWHGARLDPERGSFAIVKEGGIFDEWLGERILIATPSARSRSVAAYVHSTSEGIDGDLSVPRRLFYALANLGTDLLSVTVSRLQ